jgi:hypothetical protein
VVEEGRGENEIVHPVNPAANVVANAPANPAANASSNAPANTAGNVANNAANAANILENVVANPGQNVGAEPPLIQANHVEGNQCQHIKDEVEIARCANYDREHGVPNALDANKPVQEADLQHMHDQELLRRAQTKTMVLLMTFTSSRHLTSRQQAREQSTTSLRSHDVSG